MPGVSTGTAPFRRLSRCRRNHTTVQTSTSSCPFCDRPNEQCIVVSVLPLCEPSLPRSDNRCNALCGHRGSHSLAASNDRILQ